MNCARSAPPDSGHFLLGKCVLSSLNAKFSPLRGPESALRAARYAGRATRAGVLRTAREADTCGPIQLMKPSGTLGPESGTRGMRGSKPGSRQGSVEWVSEQRAHSIGLAAAAVLVAPLV